MNETGIAIRRGTLYFPATLCARHFAGLDTVILLARGADLLILPVRHAAAGGYLLKHRNSAGDRVVDAAGFFRAQGLDEAWECDAGAQWDDALAALVARDVLPASSAN